MADGDERRPGFNEEEPRFKGPIPAHFLYISLMSLQCEQERWEIKDNSWKLNKGMSKLSSRIMSKALNISLSEELYNRMMQLSKESELSLSSIARLAIKHYIGDNNQ